MGRLFIVLWRGTVSGETFAPSGLPTSLFALDDVPNVVKDTNFASPVFGGFEKKKKKTIMGRKVMKQETRQI